MSDRRPFTRAQVLARLRKTIGEGRPIVSAGSSGGIIARASEVGGADLIIVYNTGTSRLMGLATTHTINHANPATMAMYKEIANVVTHTPIIGGAEAQDPTYLNNLEGLVDDYRETGFDGIINFPTMAAGNSTPRGRERSAVGLGLDRDFEMVRIARKKDVFTCCYAYTEEQAAGLAAAGVDAIVPHSGWTVGGLAGNTSARSMDEACEHTQKLIDLARKENPEVICLSHGGPLAGPAETQHLYAHTDAQGFLGASSMERIPVENGILGAVRALKALTPRVVAASAR